MLNGSQKDFKRISKAFRGTLRGFQKDLSRISDRVSLEGIPEGFKRIAKGF